MKQILCSLVLATLLTDRADANELAEQIASEALEQGVDPKLAVAIATVESSLNPNAVGVLGEQGLFQLRPEYHQGVVDADPSTNIRRGVRYLRFVIRTCASRYKDAAFICFNTGPYRTRLIRVPKQFPYYRKVMEVYRSLDAQYAVVN